MCETIAVNRPRRNGLEVTGVLRLPSQFDQTHGPFGAPFDARPDSQAGRMHSSLQGHNQTISN
jgi:hypothetical protein